MSDLELGEEHLDGESVFVRGFDATSHFRSYITQLGHMRLYVSTATHVKTSPKSKTVTHSAKLATAEKASKRGSNCLSVARGNVHAVTS